MEKVDNLTPFSCNENQIFSYFFVTKQRYYSYVVQTVLSEVSAQV